MSGPDIVRIKRKRDTLAPDTLIVEPVNKKQKEHIEPELRYVLQRDPKPSKSATEVNKSEDYPSSSVQTPEPTRRIFHLTPHRPGSSSPRKRKTINNDGRDIATFVEKRTRSDSQDVREANASQDYNVQTLKRPGRGAAVRFGGVVSQEDDTKMEVERQQDDDLQFASMAASLHQFALDEVARESKTTTTITTTTTAMPKLSGQRSKEIHRQRAAAHEAKLHDCMDIEKNNDEETDYVYDTYVLAPRGDLGAVQIEGEEGVASGNVGYLIISEEDQAVWETYIEDEPSDREGNSDEEDENAEDWYGADYPDEELASDDEFNRNAYGYRDRGGSDDEQWDARDTTWSDDEYERQMQPWRKKTAEQFRKYLENPDEE